jgi:hypothetical protein
MDVSYLLTVCLPIIASILVTHAMVLDSFYSIHGQNTTPIGKRHVRNPEILQRQKSSQLYCCAANMQNCDQSGLFEYPSAPTTSCIKSSQHPRFLLSELRLDSSDTSRSLRLYYDPTPLHSPALALIPTGLPHPRPFELLSAE